MTKLSEEPEDDEDYNNEGPVDSSVNVNHN